MLFRYIRTQPPGLRATTTGARNYVSVAVGVLFVLLAGVVILLVRSCGAPKAVSWPPQWSSPTLSRVVATAAIQNAVVYCASTDATVYAISLPTGKPLWQRPLAMPSTAPPLVKYGLVFVGSNEPSFQAFDALTGTPVWKVSVPAPVSQPATFAKGRVFFTDDSGVLRAVEAVSGRFSWRFEREKPLSAPITTGKGICVATLGWLHCLDAASGALRWSVKIGGSRLCSPATDGKAVLVGGGEDELLAVRAADGSEVWSESVGAAVEMPPWLLGKSVLVCAGSRILCLNKTDGGLLWSRSLG